MTTESATGPATLRRLVGQLRDDRGMIRYQAYSVDENTHSVRLVIDEVSCWNSDDSPSDPYEEVAVFCVKWDGCAHVGFRSPDLNKNWVHVCGVDNMRLTLRMMQWAWDMAVSMLRDRGFDDDDLAELSLLPNSKTSGPAAEPADTPSVDGSAASPCSIPNDQREK